MIWLDNFKQHCLECFPQEAVGYVENKTFFPLENIHNDPVNFFSISPETSLMLGSKQYFLLHSHTMLSFENDPRTPSEEDMIGQRNTNVPWGIVHCDGQNVSDILWLENPNETIPALIGRNYKANITDCFTLARDFYRINFNIDFGTHPRPADWEQWNPHYISSTYEKVGFKQIPARTELVFGDILLFSIGSKYINHIGIFLQKETFLHHLYKQQSAEDSLKKWQRLLVKVIRHKDARKNI